MSETPASPQAPAESFEPYEEHRGIPLPVYWIAIALALWGAVMLYHNAKSVSIGHAQRSAMASELPRAANMSGADIFMARCSTCHQDNASGVTGAVPPLEGSPFVAARPEVVPQILLHGINGPVRVGNETFNGHMPDFASVLSDNEIARVATYVRKRWGGAKQDIDAGFVTAQRVRFAGKGAWQGGAEIAAVLDPSLAPQPAYTGNPLPAIDPATLSLVQNGRGDLWSCASCHGAQGEGHDDVPRLAGLPDAYIAKQLADFAAGKRDNDTMTMVARQLSPAERADIGRYYASLPTPSNARPVLGGDLARGEQLALEGDWNKGVPACFSCHGPSGFGVAPGFPSIAAQHAPYIARQLDAWKGGTRTNSPLSMMQKIAAKLSDADIRAVADYLAALPPVPAPRTRPKEPDDVRPAAAANH